MTRSSGSKMWNSKGKRTRVPIRCPLCDRTCKTVSGVKTHALNYHKLDLDKYTPDQVRAIRDQLLTPEESLKETAEDLLPK